MQFNPYDTGQISTTQGICPDGWHIPSYQEWKYLIDPLGAFPGNPETEGMKKLMESGLEHWCDEGGTNETGFTALPGGYLMNAPWVSTQYYFENLWDIGSYWTASECTGPTPSSWCMHYVSIGLGYSEIQEGDSKRAYSVRCIKDP